MHSVRDIDFENTEFRVPERVVVLGGGGFVGRHILRRLSKLTIDTLSLSSRELDLSRPNAAAALASMLQPTDSIVFLAATKAGSNLDHEGFVRNVAMATALCSAAGIVGCSHLLYLSSDSVYPFADSAIREDSPTSPSSLYGTMHLTRETMLSNLDQVPLGILRISQVYGPDDTHLAYGPCRMIRSALTEGRIVLFGTGEETRDHVYVDDVVSVIVDVLLRRRCGVLNVASGRSISFAELAEVVVGSCDRPIRIEHEPARMPVFHRRFDTTALRSIFPICLQTPLEEGVRVVIQAEKQYSNSSALSAR